MCVANVRARATLAQPQSQRNGKVHKHTNRIETCANYTTMRTEASGQAQPQPQYQAHKHTTVINTENCYVKIQQQQKQKTKLQEKWILAESTQTHKTKLKQTEKSNCLSRVDRIEIHYIYTIYIYMCFVYSLVHTLYLLAYDISIDKSNDY